jgi:NADPH2 dehydrogenase
MAPVSRYRADENHIPTPIMQEYYGQRARVPGTLIIGESTFISPDHGGYANAPGIYNEKQIEAWRKVTDEVHTHGSYIVAQLLAVGRSADVKVATREGVTITSSSAISQDDDHAIPVPLTVAQIQETIRCYVSAAKNAIRAGFDAVEVHGGYGYLIDQFLQDTVNHRTDEYGGSIENRSRFAIEVVSAVVEAIGAERTALRLSPWSRVAAMRMADPVPQFSHVIREMNALGPLAYLHLIEPVVHGFEDIEAPKMENLDFACALWDGPILLAGGYQAQSARELLDEKRNGQDIVVVFGRYFISNPDLPFRVRWGLDFTHYKREFFCTPMTREGYTDYSFSPEFIQATTKQL